MSKQKVRRCRDVRFELDGKTVAELIEYLPKLGLPEGARITFDTVDDFGTYVPEVSFDWFEQETDEEYTAETNRQLAAIRALSIVGSE